MKRPDTSPQAYADSVTDPRQRAQLEALRTLLHEVAPDRAEAIRYGMIEVPGLACLAAQKHHVALYVDPDVVAEHAHLLPDVDHGKSCLRFRKTAELPLEALRTVLVARLAKG